MKTILLILILFNFSIAKNIVILDNGVFGSYPNLKHDSKGSILDDHGTHLFGIISNFLTNKKDTFFSINIGNNPKIEDYLVGLQKAIELNPNIINISYTHKEFNSIEEILIRSSKKIKFVVAAGNESIDLDKNPRFPCSYNLSNLICVGSKNKDISKFSNYGSKIIYRNGENVVSLGLNGLTIYSGTSQATALYTRELIKK